MVTRSVKRAVTRRRSRRTGAREGEEPDMPGRLAREKNGEPGGERTGTDRSVREVTSSEIARKAAWERDSDRSWWRSSLGREEGDDPPVTPGTAGAPC